MSAKTPAELSKDIAVLAEQLQHDVDDDETKGPAFIAIRAIRRELNTLELELRDEPLSTLGEAC
jgi:hypothetical protein